MISGDRLLDSLPDAFEDLAVAEEQVRRGELISLDEFRPGG